jgi:hypothetical protein
LSTVTEIIERSGVDITLNGSLLIGYDLAAVQVGVLGYGSGLLMVKCENRSEVDEFGRGLFEWRMAGWLHASDAPRRARAGSRAIGRGGARRVERIREGGTRSR